MLKILTTYANKLGHHRTWGILLSKHSNHVHVIRQCSFLVCYVCAEGSDPSQWCVTEIMTFNQRGRLCQETVQQMLEIPMIPGFPDDGPQWHTDILVAAVINQPYISSKTNLDIVMNLNVFFVRRFICDSVICDFYELFELEIMGKIYILMYHKLYILQCRPCVGLCFIMYCSLW